MFPDIALGRSDGCQDGRHDPGPALPRRRGGRAPRQRRRRFLDAGLDLLGGASDPAELTVRAICRQAGLAARYFYESFSRQGRVRRRGIRLGDRRHRGHHPGRRRRGAARRSRTGPASPTSSAPSARTPASGGCCSTPSCRTRCWLRKRAELGGVFAMLAGQHVTDALRCEENESDQGDSRTSSSAGVGQTISGWLSGDIALIERSWSTS